MGQDGRRPTRDNPHRQRRPGPVARLAVAERYSPQQPQQQQQRRQQQQQRQNTVPEYWPDSSETLVHFHKSFGVMQELFDHRDFSTLVIDLLRCAAEAAPLGVAPEPRFLDLGCAPGGFSACLLQDNILGPGSVGFGVSLPPHLGGFQMAFASDRLVVQMGDLLGLTTVDLLAANNSIDFCVADAQYLKNMVKKGPENSQYLGLHVKSRSLGIWALTVKECQLAFSKLRHNGSFVFRFGWRGIGATVHPTGEQVHPSLLAKYLEEEEWYKALTHWLFSVLKSLFNTLKPFKSEYVHQADVSFYMICRNFDRKKYERYDWEAKLQRAFDELSGCQDEAALVEGIKDQITDETKADIDDLLEVVARMRAIGIESRKVTNPDKFKAGYVQKSGRQSDGGDHDAALSDAENTSSTSAACSSRAGGAPSLPSDASTAAEESAPAPAIQASDQDGRDAGTSTRRLRPPNRHEGEASQVSRSTPDGRGLRWRAVKPSASQRQAQQVRAPAQDVQPSAWDGSGVGDGEGCFAPARVPGAGPPWTATQIESIAEVACADELELEKAYSRHLHVSRFQSQLLEWQQLEAGHRSREQEETAKDHARRALYVQNFHSQLQQQQQQQRQQQQQWQEQLDVGQELSQQNSKAHAYDQLQGFQAGSSASCKPQMKVFDAHAIPDAPAWSADAGLPTQGDAFAWMPLQCTTPSTRHAEATGFPLGPHLAAQQLMPWPPAEAQPWLEYPPAPGVTMEPGSQIHDEITPAASSSVPSIDSLAATSAALASPPLAVQRVAVAAPDSPSAAQPPLVTKEAQRKPQPPAKDSNEAEEVVESDSLASSDEDGRDTHRKVYRHKKRAGRVVRERRMGRRKRNNPPPAQSAAHSCDWQKGDCFDTWCRVKASVSQSLTELIGLKLYLHAMRFGLFCAMAWSMNSILFSASRFSPR